MRIPEPLFHRDPAAFGGQSGDEILIEILEDGNIKITTDPVSGPNHMSAEGLLRTIGEIAGSTTRARRVRTQTTSQKQHIHGHAKG
jgi:hypothetical protein